MAWTADRQPSLLDLIEALVQRCPIRKPILLRRLTSANQPNQR
jgi:hypothetical protein